MNHIPNYKAFQDEPDKLRIKIFGANNVAVNTDATGNVAVSTVGTIPVSSLGTLPVCTTAVLPVCSIADIPICATQTVPVCATATMPVCTTAIVPVCTTATVAVSSVGTVPISGTVLQDLRTQEEEEILANITSTDFSSATTRTVLGWNAWTFAVKNTSLAENAQAVVAVQMSATALDESDWLTEVGPVTLNQNSLAFLTSSLLVKYARIYYRAVNASSAVTLSIYFQAQT